MFVMAANKPLTNGIDKHFITQSHYEGTWTDSLQCMDGYGVYTFPDGSEYRGYFSRGHFHGYGTLHLTAPYSFTFKGTFIDGSLEEIDEMWFDDGLQVNASIDKWSMDFSSWKYCTNKDRRYAEEHREGLQAIGPFSRLTPQAPPRALAKNYYDVGEGIYNAFNGLITQRPLPFSKMRFVACKEEMEWIKKNCRIDHLSNKRLSPEIRHKIIDNNLNNELELAEHVPSCNHDQDKNRKRYFAKLCDREFDENDHMNSDDSVGSRLRNSSTTCSSFCNTSMDIDVEEILFLAHAYNRYNLGRNLSEEASVLVRDRAY
ncbi:uncharacterized protein ACRADG_003481 [Cochliomyia hominivorax]